MYDATHDKSYQATVVINDSDHTTLVFSVGDQIEVAWEDCPEYDSHGRLTGKRLTPWACRDVNGSTARDSRGTEWIIDLR